MESPPATMASTAGATHIHRGLPGEMVVWEILVRLPPKPLLRCRAVCHAWRRATSTRAFLQAHHARQRSLPVVSWSRYDGHRYEDFLTFDHKAAAGTRLQPLVRLKDYFYPEAYCEGLLILSKDGASLSVCNPTTRQHAPLPQLSGLDVLGMYAHQSTGEYQLLLRRIYYTDCYVFTLGSDQPPRHVGVLEGVEASAYFDKPTLLRRSLHWYIVHYPHQYHQAGQRDVIVFDTTSETFRRMRAPVVLDKSYIFEMDGTLGIYSYNNTTQIVDIWVLRDYESEVWGHKYSVELPAEEIKRFGWPDYNWRVTVLSVDGDVLLLVTHGGWMFRVGIDGKLVDNFHRDGQHASTCKLSLKQTLVPHTFFATLEGYVVNTLPFL
ncbi:hypothetical protein QYE76_025791 [Lolium multiflorum]|uniref:F-box domain-containing protein n=1 Tax=Lolium multiflorum TaxID=4521 RepID=A0AAD8RHH2_LOLMU|nr:hypothetical protein QYE76_025791 [Lolium multiflorum]